MYVTNSGARRVKKEGYCLLFNSSPHFRCFETIHRRGHTSVQIFDTYVVQYWLMHNAMLVPLVHTSVRLEQNTMSQGLSTRQVLLHLFDRIDLNRARHRRCSAQHYLAAAVSQAKSLSSPPSLAPSVP